MKILGSCQCRAAMSDTFGSVLLGLINAKELHF